MAQSAIKSSDRPNEPFADQVYFLLRERILKGILSPGTVLSRRQLADEFEVSFLPVSEALQRLESEGLVESRPRVGTRVRTPTQSEVRGRYVVREALEAQSAMLCCERATIRQRLELQRMAEHLDTLYKRLAKGYERLAEEENDVSFQYAVHSYHLELHMRIAEYAGCPELKEAIERNHILIYNWFYDVTIRRRVLPDAFHSDLIKVITGNSVTKADRAMRIHVRYGLDDLLEAIGSQSAGDWRLKR